MPDSIRFNIDEWQVAAQERKRNRMKVIIKLNKQETEAFRSFTETVKPTELSDDQFLKSIFMYGIDAINTELAEAVKQYAEEHKDELATSGIEVSTSGPVAQFHSIESEGSVEMIDSSEEE